MGGNIPLPALGIQPPQQQDPLGNLEKMARLRSLAQAHQVQQGQIALQPGQQQLQQQEIQQKGIATQEAQLDLQDRKGFDQALKDSYGATTQAAPVNGTAPPAANASPIDRLGDLAARISDPKYGISARGQIAAMSQFNQLKGQLADTDTKTIGALQAAHKQMQQGLNSVLEAPPEDQAAQWTLERNQLMRDPTLSKYASVVPAQYPGQPAEGGSPEAQRLLHGLMLSQDLVAATKEKAELPGQQAESAIKQGQEKFAQQTGIPAGVSPETVSYAAYLRAGGSPQGYAGWKAGQEAKATQPYKLQEAIAVEQARADIETKMARGSNAALAEVPKNLISTATEGATKAGEDFAQSQAVKQRLTAMMKAAKAGNVISYQILPEEGAIQVVTSQGIHRVNQSEFAQYGGGGSAWQRLVGHAGKQLSGKSIPDSVLGDMEDIQKIQSDGAQSKYENSLKTINQNTGAKFKPVDMGQNEPTQKVFPKEPSSGATQTTGKTLSTQAIQQAAKDHGVSVDEAKRQAVAAGYTVQ